MAAGTPLYSDLAELVPAVVYTAAADDAGSTLYVNRHIETMLGFTPEEWLADPQLWLRQLHEDDRARVGAIYSALRPGDPPISYEYRIRRRDGREIWVRDFVQLMRASPEAAAIYLGVMVDITEEKARTEALVRKEESYRQMFEANPAPMWIYDLATLRFLAVNDAATARYGYSREEFLGMTIRDIRPAEDIPRLLENIAAVTGGLDEAGLWRHVRKNGSVIDVRITSHTLDYDGRHAEAVLAEDVTGQLQALRQIGEHAARMEEMILQTAAAFGEIVEQRDPYTAGHQRRVGELGAAIAAEMGLDAGTQRGLRVAGALHDVGKVAVPAEILARPGRLPDAEMVLIQAHAQAGYDVLRHVDFPWPVAEIARQHHERMDGSGYPRGLRGDAILPEARIIAVADVIEAMWSHRPYRPALGIDVALAEVENGRGTLFATDVANAALRLFRDRGYRMPE